jgi:hypothetical protein
VKTPTWGEVEEFCRKDGWKHVRDTDHSFFRKVLEDGTVLETHTSFSSKKSMSPGRFAAVLRVQLRVSQEDFWETIRTGKPATRPSAPLPEPAPALPAWLVKALQLEVGLSEADIGLLDEAAAREVLDRQRSSYNE